MNYDVNKIREDFPILQQQVHRKPLVYLDNGATTQKPRQVINAIEQYYQSENANIHRGIYYLSELATQRYEAVRDQVQHYLNAASREQIIFTSGTTAAINLVAQSYARNALQAGDELIISAMEHHANIVPWQIVCEQTGATLKVIPIHDNGELDMTALQKMLSTKTKFLAITHVSNVLGTINPVKKITAMAHEFNVPVLLDGAQAVQHFSVDVQDLGCDFYVFSAHKLYGPTGVGVLYGKKSLLEEMPPYQTGGDMIHTVSFEKTTFAGLPNKFEAGTPNIAGVVGLGEALTYVSTVGLPNIEQHEKNLLTAATERLNDIAGLRIIGTAAEKSGVISFVLNDIHPHDIATILDSEGVAIRAGHHCAMPLMTRFNVPATARASFGLYNTHQEIEQLAVALDKTQKVFA